MHRIEGHQIDDHLRRNGMGETEDQQQKNWRGQGEEKEHGQDTPHPGRFAALMPVPKPVGRPPVPPLRFALRPLMRAASKIAAARARGARCCRTRSEGADRLVPTTSGADDDDLSEAIRPYSMAVAPLAVKKVLIVGHGSPVSKASRLKRRPQNWGCLAANLRRRKSN